MSTSFWNPRLHLQPRNGWLNDPNGLCEFNGFYHAFYQYAPEWPQDELKHWGHCTSKDLLHWSDQGIALSPDINEDQNGVFSGSAWIDHGASPDGENLMRVFYTGNVVDTTIDERVDEGREANEIMVTSEDGVHFSEKKSSCAIAIIPKPAPYTSEIPRSGNRTVSFTCCWAPVSAE